MLNDKIFTIVICEEEKKTITRVIKLCSDKQLSPVLLLETDYSNCEIDPSYLSTFYSM